MILKHFRLYFGCFYTCEPGLICEVNVFNSSLKLYIVLVTNLEGNYPNLVMGLFDLGHELCFY